VTCDWSAIFSGTSISSTNKTDRHDMTVILLKVGLNTIKPKKKNQTNKTKKNKNKKPNKQKQKMNKHCNNIFNLIIK
jgi:hypothetical protein